MKREEALTRPGLLMGPPLAAGSIPLAGTEWPSETWGSRSGSGRSASSAAPRIVARSLIFKPPSKDPYDLENLHGFNHATSVITLPDGRLLAAWFSGPFEGSVHQSILASLSANKGRSWEPTRVLQDTPRSSDFDPAFIVDGRRTWFFYSTGRWNRYPAVRDEKTEIGVGSFKVYHRYSDDSGRTWSAPQMVLEKVGMGCRSNGIKLTTGELLLPVHSFGSNLASVLKSADGGKSWTRFGEIKTTTRAAEPSLVQLTSAEILMVLRTTDGFIWQTLSKDNGETWTPAERTNIEAPRAPHNIFRLDDGRLLLTHNASKTVRTPLGTRISTDEGKTWSEPFVLAAVGIPEKTDAAWSHQVSYPSATRLDARTVLFVWGEVYLSALEQYGDIHSATVEF